MNKNNFWQKTNHLEIFLIFLFILCVLWYYLIPTERTLHEQLLHLTFIGFSGMNFWSFILVAIQSYVWGYIFLGL
ncbi:MAG: hypothetical protein COU28_00195 [Candidatus Magasanikbacteria bacterium CG10_big_fil_rev_8_21_14_0_10_36_16]|uniref:Uncharacterized protein n=1 Tax=Candidatus Magasanikbacteria bacterium CG10_big_fil_rev_8_21_14_0_10_36_16 TaxID=1974645 RepID=A0A2H0TZN8_9BACT|nr:MAG: hypothetical protein COU28_00195 [Candidatus Magasanikbacteria bacterium CG10_big_fil_rev_8_21_14_0_10_36_16]